MFLSTFVQIRRCGTIPRVGFAATQDDKEDKS